MAYRHRLAGLMPLIMALISLDAIVDQMERGIMRLLLSNPIARW